MPYTWQTTDDGQQLDLWPYRSLPKRGFAVFILCTSGLLALPLFPLLGSPTLWVLLPFLIAAVAAIWFALQRNYKDGEIVEQLHMTPQNLRLTRHGPRGKVQTWEGNPYWVRVQLHAKGGPVPNYLTLKGGPREVEIGAFLSEEERLSLADDLGRHLAQARV